MYVRIKDGKIDLLVEANPFGLFKPDFAADFIECDPNADYTWVVQDGILVPPPPPPPPAPQLPVPAHCTRRQGQLMLLSLGLLDDAEAAIAAIADPMDRRAAQIEYDADTWERSNAFLSGLWAQLGGTPASLDEAFRTAVTL